MTASISTYWRILADGKGNRLLDRLLLLLLIPFSIPYSLVMRLRSRLYKEGILQSRRLPRPVISIGNLTVGGTGKTPVTAFIARFLLEQGYKVAVLSRGYGGTLEGTTAIVSDGKQLFHSAEECGDEPFLLAGSLPGLMVVIGSDRHAAGLLAMEELSPDIFLLDDGFQHLRLQRDLNILLLDQGRPFGNGWTLPAGLMREPQSAAARANLVILTRCSPNDVTPENVLEKKVYRSRHKLVDAIPLAGGEAVGLESIGNKRVLAFAGIAAPELFFEGLREKGLRVVETLCFQDHAAYDPATITLISEAAEATKAELLITTEKDGVKLKLLPEALRRKTVLARLELEIEDAESLHELLLHTTKERGTDANQSTS